MSDQYVKLEEERRQKEKVERKKKEKKRKEKRSGRGRKHDSGPESEEDITPAHMVDIVTEEMPEVGWVLYLRGLIFYIWGGEGVIPLTGPYRFFSNARDTLSMDYLLDYLLKIRLFILSGDL